MFLDLQVSCDQDKNNAGKKLTIQMWSQSFAQAARFGCQKIFSLKGSKNMDLVNILKTSNSQNGQLLQKSETTLQ